MDVEIISPEKTIYRGTAESVTFPGREGQFQVLENHAPLFALLDKGEIIVGKDRKIPIFSGVVEVLKNKVFVLIKT